MEEITAAAASSSEEAASAAAASSSEEAASTAAWKDAWKSNPALTEPPPADSDGTINFRAAKPVRRGGIAYGPDGARFRSARMTMAEYTALKPEVRGCWAYMTDQEAKKLQAENIEAQVQKLKARLEDRQKALTVLEGEVKNFILQRQASIDACRAEIGSLKLQIGDAEKSAAIG